MKDGHFEGGIGLHTVSLTGKKIKGMGTHILKCV